MYSFISATQVLDSILQIHQYSSFIGSFELKANLTLELKITYLKGGKISNKNIRQVQSETSLNTDKYRCIDSSNTNSTPNH